MVICLEHQQHTRDLDMTMSWSVIATDEDTQVYQGFTWADLNRLESDGRDEDAILCAASDENGVEWWWVPEGKSDRESALAELHRYYRERAPAGFTPDIEFRFFKPL